MAKPPIIWKGNDTQIISPGTVLNQAGAPIVPLISRSVYLCEDWIVASVAGSTGWNSLVSGTVATNTIGVSEAGHPGFVICNTGTDTTGRAGMLTSTAGILLGTGATSWEAIVRIPILSTSSEEFATRIGISDGTGGDATDGVYFEYNRAASGDVWLIKTASNSSRTTKVLDGTSGNPTSAVAAATWYHLRADVNADGTLATFYVNGTSVGTISTNIPTTSGRVTSAGFNTIKSAGSTARTFEVDAFSLSILLSTSR